jgi:ABC-type polysaccharide/polyol phosphate transport system ATPase subunit
MGDEFWALWDVSFSVQPGEVLGIIGANGAGKTTILKILAGVTKPTRGTVALTGNVSALIELGAGFHPELTGRENIYLNSAILGLKRHQIRRILDDIVAFAELEDFIDTPVKRYSSGMYARLGFSVAVHVDPDILLVDEVLSVGDVGFQQKSLRRMLDFKMQAKAMVFVSHNLVAVQSVCNRVLYLEKGKIRSIGSPAEVIPAFQRHLTSKDPGVGHARSHAAMSNSDHRSLWIESVVIQDSTSNPTSAIRPDDPVSVALQIRNPGEPLEVTVALAVYQQDGTKCGETNSTSAGQPMILCTGSNLVRVDFDHMSLVPGGYYLNAAVSQGHLVRLHHLPYAASFEVRPLPEHVIVKGPVYLAGHWSLDRA